MLTLSRWRVTCCKWGSRKSGLQWGRYSQALSSFTGLREDSWRQRRGEVGSFCPGFLLSVQTLRGIAERLGLSKHTQGQGPRPDLPSRKHVFQEEYDPLCPLWGFGPVHSPHKAHCCWLTQQGMSFSALSNPKLFFLLPSSDLPASVFSVSLALTPQSSCKASSGKLVRHLHSQAGRSLIHTCSPSSPQPGLTPSL